MPSYHRGGVISYLAMWLLILMWISCYDSVEGRLPSLPPRGRGAGSQLAFWGWKKKVPPGFFGNGTGYIT